MSIGQGRSRPHPGRHGKREQRETVAQIVERIRHAAAVSAWQRARIASGLRHIAARQGRSGAAAILSRIKAAAIIRAAEIAPELAHVTIDAEFQVGLPSVCWANTDRLHMTLAAASILLKRLRQVKAG